MNGKYVIMCNEQGGILNDPVLLRIAEDEFWFSLSDSNIEWWLRGVNCKGDFRVSIAEIDVCPVEIQGPKSVDLMVDLVDEFVCELPYCGLTEAKIGSRDVVISQLGFTGEKGYEIYLRDATYYAADMWNAVLAAGYRHNLMITAPAHHRRIGAGILSCGQDIDQETLPFQCNLAYQVPRKKTAPYIGKERLEQVRSEIEAGRYPFKNIMVGLTLGGLPITDCAGLLACIRAGRRNPRRLHDLALVFARAPDQHRSGLCSGFLERDRHRAEGLAAGDVLRRARPTRRCPGCGGAIPAVGQSERAGDRQGGWA